MLINNIKVEILNNDISIKLSQLLNELNLTFTVDNLSKVLELMLTMYVEDMTIESSIKLVEKLRYESIFDDQDISAAIKVIYNFMYQIMQEDINISAVLKCEDKLKYEYIVNIIYEANIKLTETLNINTIQEDINISISGGLNISAMRTLGDLKSITMGSLKTMTLWNLYFKDN